MDRDLFKHGAGGRGVNTEQSPLCQEFIGLLVPLCTDNEVLMAMVGGQSRCDGWTVRYETVVGYFELEHLLGEREEGGGSRICPLCSSAAHKCPKQCGQRCQLGGREGVAEIRQGAGRSQRPGGAGSGADIFQFLCHRVWLAKSKAKAKTE